MNKSIAQEQAKLAFPNDSLAAFGVSVLAEFALLGFDALTKEVRFTESERTNLQNFLVACIASGWESAAELSKELDRLSKE